MFFGILTLFIVLNLTVCSCSKDKAPEEWAPRIAKGEHSISKKTFLDAPRIGIITDISKRKRHGKINNDGFVISGKHGAVLADNEGNIIDTIALSEMGERVVYFEPRKEKDILFINRGGGWQSPSVHNKAGRLLWKYSPIGATPNDMSAGDINGDGNPEFVVGLSGKGGVVLLNQDGRQIWQVADINVWHVEMIDLNDDGTLEIVHSNNQGAIVIRNANGEIIEQKKIPLYFGKFSLLHWPNFGGGLHYLISENQKLYIISSQDISQIEQFNAPLSVDNYTLGTQVKFERGKPPAFAAIVEVRSSWKRSILYIFSSKKELIYQEILPTSIAALSVATDEKSGKEILLVGGDGVVWEYFIDE